MKLSGLRARLLLLLGVAVLPAIALLLTGRAAERRSTQRELNTQAMNLARLTAQGHGQRIEQARQLLLALATHPVIGGTDVGACNQLAQKLATEYAGIYATIGRARAEDGVVDCLALEGAPPGMPSPIGMSITDRDYFQRAKAEDGFVVGDFIHGKIRRQPILAFALPMSQNDRITHVLFANFDLVVMSRALERETRLEGTTVALLDRNGSLIARSSEADRFFGVKPTPAVFEAMGDQRETISTIDDSGGVRRVTAIASVRDRAGVLLGFSSVGIPENDVDALLAPGSDWVTIAVLAIGLFIVTWIGSELLIRQPVAKLVAATEGLATGELGVRAAPVGGVRELQVLATALNQMAGKLQERELHLREGQRLEAVGQLAGGIAHDFNNLLTIIIGYADALKDSLPPATPEGEQLAELRAASERAAKLTQQLLAFSRRQVLLPTPLQLNEVVTDMVSLLKRTTGGDVVMSLDLDPDLGMVYADRVQMEQVLLNLAINARDAMPSGGTLAITTRAITAGDAPFVELSMSDSGVGMDHSTRIQIFEPFFTTKGLHGTGLGLATVYGIVKQSGGEIICDSEIGRGTTFRVRLPRHAGSVGPQETARPPQPVGGSESIVLVDDDSAVRRLLELLLQRNGYDVRSTGNPKEALQWFADGFRPDLLITDIRMAEMNGMIFARLAKEHAPSIKIILMSGDAAPTLAGQAEIDGVTFEQKPVASAVLLRAVRSRLDES